MKNYLIEGVSGAGKTTVGAELNRRGYQAIHGDRELVYRGDPKTGQPISSENYENNAAWMSEHQLWDIEKVTSHIDDKDEILTFFCGGSRNFLKFVDLLDGVFILDVDLETMARRIDKRVAIDPTDFGATPEEKELILHLYATKQDIPKDGIRIDANRPLELIVDEILSHCQVENNTF
jgi:thymidylate kinase